MSYKKVKALNLVPQQLRYDYVKDLILRGSIAFICCLTLLIIFDYLYFSYKNSFLQKQLKQLTAYNESLLKEINSLNQYEKEYNKLKKELTNANKTKNELKLFYPCENSSLLSTIIALSSKSKDIYFNKLSYNNGQITIDGYAMSSSAFYKYYKKLEHEKDIKNVKFQFIKKTEKGRYNFKIIMEPKKINEIS
ncbi:PilN domain-containing protein [Deferribacter autotrophicus]|uniref:PilN domain-containing protein n=1 Tax=Deferribacter autotrophicus TaxID=500465 RepID=A0A5A8F653_9BACT|nr:PilN domain-containing protein [Deferribacter autotrophicus]KAA0257353.1 PilN domain-containing protein [Deferribacter autotrophicus]